MASGAHNRNQRYGRSRWVPPRGRLFSYGLGPHHVPTVFLGRREFARIPSTFGACRAPGLNAATSRRPVPLQPRLGAPGESWSPSSGLLGGPSRGRAKRTGRQKCPQGTFLSLEYRPGQSGNDNGPRSIPFWTP